MSHNIFVWINEIYLFILWNIFPNDEIRFKLRNVFVQEKEILRKESSCCKIPPTHLKLLHAYPSPSATEVFALQFIRYINQYKHHPPVTELFALLHIRSIQEPSLSRHFPYSESMFATFKIQNGENVQRLHFFCKGYITDFIFIVLTMHPRSCNLGNICQDWRNKLRCIILIKSPFQNCSKDIIFD